MNYLSPIIKKRLEEKLSKLNKLRPLPKSAVQKLREKFQIEMTYNSNAIEGNSLTLKETFLVINEGLTVKGKPLKDHLEAKDHYAALEYLYDLIDRNKKHKTKQHGFNYFLRYIYRSCFNTIIHTTFFLLLLF